LHSSDDYTLAVSNVAGTLLHARSRSAAAFRWSL